VHEKASKAKGREMDWRNLMEKLFNVWRDNSLSLWAWVLFILALGLIIYLSVN